METELRDLLRDLVQATGAEHAAIVSAQLDAGSDGARRLPLGMGSVMEVRLGEDEGRDDIDAALERASRALRACVRRWGATEFPAVHYASAEAPSRNRVLDRVRDYLQAFANAQGVVNAAVTCRNDVIASAAELSELQRERLPFLLKQVDAETRSRKGETSHVEIIRDDLCAFSFWVDACLIAFCESNFSSDFLRHRARMVTREIGQLLPYLDDPPGAPVIVAPIPE